MQGVLCRGELEEKKQSALKVDSFVASLTFCLPGPSRPFQSVNICDRGRARPANTDPSSWHLFPQNDDVTPLNCKQNKLVPWKRGV